MQDLVDAGGLPRHVSARALRLESLSMFRDQTAGRPLRFNPFQPFADLHPGWRDVRYGICNWLERFDGASGRTLAASAPGVFGFCPWIDFEEHIVGVFAARSGMQKAFPVYLELKALVKELGIARQQGGFHEQ